MTVAATESASNSAPKPAPEDDAAPVEPALKKMRVSSLLGVPTAPSAPVPVQHDKAFLAASGEWAAAEAITNAMPRDHRLPLTILTGFLGAGKSTVLNFILKADHGLSIAVLINEYGEVDIDNQLVDTMTQGKEGEPVVLNNGCICCTVSNGFIEAVQAVLKRADETGKYPDYFIVETTGLAEPKPIMDSISETELREDLYVDQVLTVVDSSAWSDKHYESETAFKQIQFADTILLSKTDLSDNDRINQVVENVLDIRPNARILRSQKGNVPISALFDLGISLTGKKRKAPGTSDAATDVDKKADGGADKKTGADIDKKEGDDELKHEHTGDKHEHGDDKHKHKDEHKHGHGHEHCDHDHEHGEDCKRKDVNHLEREGFSSLSFVTERPLSMRRFKMDFMDELPIGVFRSKGLLWFFSNDDTRFVFHWSGSRFNVEQQEWPEGVTRDNQLVVIGRNLDKALITTMLEGCIVKPDEEEAELEEERREEEEALEEAERYRRAMEEEEDDEEEDEDDEGGAEGVEGVEGAEGEKGEGGSRSGATGGGVGDEVPGQGS